MKLKRFVALDTRSAMQKIKETFGPDALILSSQNTEGGVEVVAAIDFDETIVSAEAALELAKPPSCAEKSVRHSPFEEMKQELETLRGMLETHLRGAIGGGDPLQAVMLQKLLYLGASPHSAMTWSRTVTPGLSQHRAWQNLLALIAEQLPLHHTRRIEEGGIYAFVGPTGVGKTTTLAKIAARFALRFGAEHLGLVTMDTYRIAAQEQLVLYGKIIGVKVCVAEDEASLLRVMRQLSDKKLILIDTPGMNPHDERVGQQVQLLSGHLQSISKALVIPATSHYQVLIDAIKHYKPSHIDQCIITKLDESMAIGGVLSAVIESGIEVSYLTHGQRVPEDIKIATAHQLMELLAQQESQIFGEEQVACKKTHRFGSEYHA